MPLKSLFIAAGQKVSGQKPSAIRAAVGATAAGTATGVLIYRLLRHDSDD